MATRQLKKNAQKQQNPPISPTESQQKWLLRGMNQPGGKLPLFDEEGQKVNERTVHSCVEHGWAEPWFNNPLKPDWVICKLTNTGREIILKCETNAAKV